MIELILIIVGLVGLFAGSITDIERREIPNWISFSLIAAGLGIRAIGAIVEHDVMMFFAGLVGLAVMAIIGEGLYYSRQWGGGDTKLLMGVGALFGSISIVPWFLFHFLVNLVIVGAGYGIVWSIYLAIRYHRHFFNGLKRIFKEVRVQCEVFSGLGVLFLLGSFAVRNTIYSTLFLILGGISMGYVVLYLFVKTVETTCMFRRLKVKNLTEGDWIAEDVIVKGKLIYSMKEPGVSKQQMNLLKKLKVKRVLVKDGIPFVPSFFIALIITLWLGNLVLLILR